MKKCFKFSFFIALLLMVGVYKVNAAFETDFEVHKDINKHLVMTPGFDAISAGFSTVIRFSDPINIADDTITIQMSDGWLIDDEETKDFTVTSEQFAVISYVGNSELHDTKPIADISFTKINDNSPWELNVSNAGRCFNHNGFFTDPMGMFVSSPDYYSSCLACTKPGMLNIYDDNVPYTEYYGIGGMVVTEAAFNEQCSLSCYISSDNKTYYGKNGQEVSYDNYKSQCMHRIENGKYYNDYNKEISEREYEERYSLRGNLDDDPSGLLRCEIDKDGRYFDAEGNEVEKDEYEKSCPSGNHDDPSGLLKCEIGKDGKYFDTEGNEVDKDEYDKQCGCHIDGDKYYNKGQEISKEDYENICQTNADTGFGNPYFFIVGGLIVTSLIFVTVKTKSKFRKI